VRLLTSPTVCLSAGFVDLPDVFRLGAIFAVWNVFIWTVVGGVWWKFLGLY
jgi:di/tricarboxylate transporter